MSDRLRDEGNFDEMIEDVTAVLDDVGSERAALVASAVRLRRSSTSPGRPGPSGVGSERRRRDGGPHERRLRPLHLLTRRREP